MDEKKRKRILIIALIAAFIGLLTYEQYYKKEISMMDYYVDGDNVVIVLDDDGQCSYDGNEWVNTDEMHACVFPYVEKMEELQIKNKYGYIASKENNLEFSIIKGVEITSGDVYLAVGGEERLTYLMDYRGSIDEKVVLSSGNEDIATIDEDNVIHGINVGETTILARFGDKTDSIHVLVTDLITLMPREFNRNKPYLYCNAYTEEENDLLDEILFSRIEKAGYQTRAAVVAAARFLALEFPYKINYFIENGRVNSYVNSFCDGEGRYYHKGLYLDESRRSNIDLSMTLGGPIEWGCPLYEYSKNRYSSNGLDCSGFVSWALLQGGFDPGDLGAGIAKDWPDLTDLGEKLLLSEELKADRLRVGDLLSGPFGAGPLEGGHIAIVAGIDKDGYIYIAEELGYANAWGYYIKKYDKSSLLQSFYYRVDMDEYYAGQDGNLTDFWIDESVTG